VHYSKKVSDCKVNLARRRVFRAASATLLLTSLSTIPALGLEQDPDCFSKKEKMRLEKAQNWEERLPHFLEMTKKRTEEWKLLWYGQHWDQQVQRGQPTFDEVLGNAKCLSKTIEREFASAAKPTSPETILSLLELSELLTTLRKRLEFAQRDDWFFDNQKRAIEQAAAAAGSAEATVWSTLLRLQKETHVSLSRPKRRPGKI
jgi:hypothetical protein